MKLLRIIGTALKTWAVSKPRYQVGLFPLMWLFSLTVSAKAWVHGEPLSLLGIVLFLVTSLDLAFCILHAIKIERASSLAAAQPTAD